MVGQSGLKSWFPAAIQVADGNLVAEGRAHAEAAEDHLDPAGTGSVRPPVGEKQVSLVPGRKGSEDQIRARVAPWPSSLGWECSAAGGCGDRIDLDLEDLELHANRCR